MDECNQFIKRLKGEYNSHILQLFGCTFNEFICATPGGKQKFNEDCLDAFEESGMAGLRYMIKSHIAILDFILFMKTEDKDWYFKDFVERATSLGIGIRKDDLVPWDWSCISSQEGIVQSASNDI